MGVLQQGLKCVRECIGRQPLGGIQIEMTTELAHKATYLVLESSSVTHDRISK